MAEDEAEPPLLAATRVHDKDHGIVVIRGRYRSSSRLPQIAPFGRRTQHSSSAHGAADRDGSPSPIMAGLPLSISSSSGGCYRGSYDTAIIASGSGVSQSNSSERRRQKLAAQRALGLTSQAGKRQHSRRKSSKHSSNLSESNKGLPQITATTR
jgi:hypothetical protein